jgi:UDP-2,3-diacylglucosamine pyrophosphatase LpxH
MINQDKRAVDLVVISDVHLGTYGCRAKELLNYLKGIDPKTLILNGDIVDIWQFSKKYFPKSHMKVVRYILKLSNRGTDIYYITGNHDELLRKFADMNFGNIKLVNKVMMDVNGKKTLFFHGDVFDFSIQHAKWLAKLGGKCYDLLILLNTFVNFCSEKFGGKRLSLSKQIKNSVKSAISFINDFETASVNYGISQKCETVVCGHIHQPSIKNLEIEGKTIQYLNSGDWVENLTSLEFHNNEWTLYQHTSNQQFDETDDEELGIAELLREFNIQAN